VIERCAGQLRLAPSGRPIGFDAPALLMLAERLGYDGRFLAEVLPAAEIGMLSGIARRFEDASES